MFYFNLLNKAKRTSFDLSMTLFFFCQVSCYVRYKGIYWQSLFRRLFHWEKAGKVGHGPKPDLVFCFFKILHLYIYKNIYTQYPSDIETDYKTNSWYKELNIVFSSCKCFGLSFLNKQIFRATNTYKSWIITAKFFKVNIFSQLVGFTGKQFSIVNKSNFIV